MLPSAWITELLDLMRESFDFEQGAEITIECNPGTADAQKLHDYRRAGINRISFGLQSADNRELALLGRIHTWETFLETYKAARAEGFGNINVDLMSALPGQTVDSWERTLGSVLELKPEHISAYSLIIEEGTPFYEKYHGDVRRRDAGEQPVFLPSEEEERQMYEQTEKLLADAGLYRYEISNYALPGQECRHNIGYWRQTEYAGFGLGASSLLGNGVFDAEESLRPCAKTARTDSPVTVRYARYRNPEDMQKYLSGDFSGREKEPLTLENRMEEFMFLGLRMMQGVAEKEFTERFGKPVDEVYGGILEKLVRQQLLLRESGRIALTARGIDLSNAVMAQFLL